MIETYRGVVYPYQLDHMEHMNVQWYTEKFDQATWHLFARAGITSDYMKKNNRGMAAVEQKIKYKAEVLAGDLLVIKSRILKVTEKSLCFFHTMTNAETDREVSCCELVGVHIDRQARTSCPFPRQIIDQCRQLIDQSPAPPNHCPPE